MPLVMLVAYRDRRSAGGSLRVLETLARALPAQGFRVEIVFAYGDAGGVAARARCKVVFLGARGPLSPRSWLRIRARIRQRKPAIIHFVDSVNWMLAALVGVRVPKLLYAHGRPIWQHQPIRRYLLSRWQQRQADGLVAISYGAKRAMVSWGLADANRIWVAPNAADFQFIEPDGIKNKSRKQGDETVRTLGMACRVTAEKGVFDAVNLLALLPKNWNLSIAGEGPRLTELQRHVHRAGLNCRVSLLGSVEDMESFYGSLDYYLFMSRYEPFGLVLAEAMSCRIPVVGLQGDGEYYEAEYPLADPSVATLVMRADPFDYVTDASDEELLNLASVIQALDRNCDQREGQIERAAQRIWERFTPAHQARAVAQAYRQLLS